MKNYFNIYVIVILGFWTSLFLTSCSKDDQIEKLEETSTENNINQSTIASTIPINEIPEIHEYLGHITNGTFAFDLNGYTVKAASQSKASDSIGALQFENVIKVTQGEYSKYTFRVKTEKWNTFNLIVKEHTKGLSHFFIEYRGALVTNYQTGRQSFSGKILTYNKLGILSGSADIDSGRSKNGFGGSGECPDGDPNNGGLPGNGGSGSGAAGPGNYAGTTVGDYGGMFNFSGFLLSHFSLGTGGGGMGTIADDSNSSNPSDDSNCHDAPLVVGFLDCNKSSTDIRNEERVLLINLSSTFKSSDCPDDGIVGGNLDNAAYNALVYDLKRIAGLSESQKSFLIQNTSPDFVFNALDYLHDENNNADSKSFIRQLVSTLQSEGHASITLRLILEGNIPQKDKVVDFLFKYGFTLNVIKLMDELVKARRNNEITEAEMGEFLESPYFLFTPDIPINNIREYLSCFDTSKGAELTIFIDQPLNNRPDAFSAAGDKAGHSFIGIIQGNIRRYYGLYPRGDATPFDPNDPHLFGNNEGSEFNLSISFEINSNSLSSIINNTINYSQNYDLNTNNCTDYVLEVATISGVTLPDPQGTWLNGGGSNPGAFGQAIRDMELPQGMTRNNNRGNAGNNSGTCN